MQQAITASQRKAMVSPEDFAKLVGLPIEAIQSQVERKLLPMINDGGSHFIDLELLRKKAALAWANKKTTGQPH